jgi:hypothetical protein
MANGALQSLAEIFNQRFFRIPDYQRGYAWQVRHLQDFWEDLENLGEEKYHYTGLLTIERVTEEDRRGSLKWQDDSWMFEKGFKAYYVVDGQQRLTTIEILMKVILDRFADNEPINFEEKRDIVKRYLFQESGHYKSFIFGYEKDDPSNEYFKTNILNQISLEAANFKEETLYTRNLKRAKEFFQEKTNGKSKPELESLYKKIVQSLRFNVYEISDDIDVFVAFEVMNNRGKPLSTLELLKNRLIYLTTLLKEEENDKKHLRKDINEAWKTAYQYLGKKDDSRLQDDDFLRDHWIMYFGYQKGEAQALENFLLKKHFTAKNLLEDRIKLSDLKNYVESISTSIQVWFQILNPMQSTFPAKSKLWLLKLNRLGFRALRPLIMAVLLKPYKDDDDVALFLQECERFNFLVFEAAKRRSDTNQSDFYRLAHEVHKDSIFLHDVLREITYGIDKWYGIEQFVLHTKDLFEREFGFYSWSGINYFLYEYELELTERSQGIRKLFWNEARKASSIEHIFPQVATHECWGHFPKQYPTRMLYCTRLAIFCYYLHARTLCCKMSVLIEKRSVGSAEVKK